MKITPKKYELFFEVGSDQLFYEVDRPTLYTGMHLQLDAQNCGWPRASTKNSLQSEAPVASACVMRYAGPAHDHQLANSDDCHNGLHSFPHAMDDSTYITTICAPV